MEPEGDYFQHIFSYLVLNGYGFEAVTILSIAVIFILLCLSAIVSGSEVAYFSFNANDQKDLEDEDHENYNKRILNLLQDQKYLLATILVGNNIINVAIVIISYFAFRQILTFKNEWLETFVNVVLITFLLVLFGEIIPKLYARNNRFRMAKISSIFLTILKKLCYPISFLLVNATDFIQKKLPINTAQVDIDELEDAIDLTTDNSDLTEDENKMLKGIINFGNIQARQVMRSRIDIESIEDTENFKDVYSAVVKTGFSRIPVYKENLDSIIGILYAKDILEHVEKTEKFKWHNLLRKPFFIPETKKIDDLLKEFQKRRMHLAIVVDEYGGTSGLITLEDVVEQVIGEIQDEHDGSEGEISFYKISENKFNFEGKTLINDLCKVMNFDVDDFEKIRGESDSLAGLILEINGRLPEKNEIVVYENYQFKVKKVKDNRIETVVVSIRENKEI